MKQTERRSTLSTWLIVLGLFFLPLMQLAAAAEPLRIGVSLGLTGKYSNMAAMSERGYRLWEEQINHAGGILGRSVQILIEDDQSDASLAKTIYRKFIEEEKVHFLFGPYSSGITAAVMPLVEEFGVPLIAGAASSDEIWLQGYRNVIGLYSPASRYVVGFLELIALRGMDDIALIAADDSFSQTAADGTAQWAQDFGLKVVIREKFSKGTRDLSGIAGRVKDAAASVVIVAGHYNESVDMLRALKATNYQPDAYFATVGPALSRFQAELGADAEDVFTSTQWMSEVVFKPGDQDLFVNPFIARYGLGPSYHAAASYAAGQILSQAIERSGSADRDKVRKVLFALDTQTIVGRYGVDSRGMQIKHFPLVSQWQDEKLIVIWPQELTSTAARFPKIP